MIPLVLAVLLSAPGGAGARVANLARIVNDAASGHPPGAAGGSESP